jgi:sarcosine oxidase subunit gamma
LRKAGRGDHCARLDELLGTHKILDAVDRSGRDHRAVRQIGCAEAARCRTAPSRTREHDVVSGETPLSLAGISDRSLAVEIRGAGSADLLAAGCLLDLDDGQFVEGACARTLFGKLPMILWRVGAGLAFRMEYARSYHAYVPDLLGAAAANMPQRAAT